MGIHLEHRKRTYIDKYIEGMVSIFLRIEKSNIEALLEELIKLKKRKGRLFFLGVGGSAANCSHAVNDFRKIANIEAYTPVDNISELTARTNDEGWETIFTQWLKGSNLSKKDAVMVFSVSGGSLEKKISTNIVNALMYSKKRGATILGIVSRNGGYTKQVANVCLMIPEISSEFITPYAESFQAIIWHLLVSYTKLRE